MKRRLLDEQSQVVFRRASSIFPQPVAVVTSRILRCRTAPEQLDSILKGAEVLTRYLAAVAVASFAAREGADRDQSLAPLPAHLSFGHFLSLVQSVSGLEVTHPAQPYLAPFKSKGKGDRKARGKADEPLTKLLSLRNDIGHGIMGLNEARAGKILKEQAPEQDLAGALSALEGVLCCPLLIIENQQLEEGRVLAIRLWLMGERQDPYPDEVELAGQGVRSLQVPYVVLGQDLLSLAPFMIWDEIPKQQRFGLLMVDGVGSAGLHYQTLEAEDVEANGDSTRRLSALVEGVRRTAERVVLADSRGLNQDWGDSKKRLEETLRNAEGAVPWSDLDVETLAWYAARLPESDGTGPRERIGKVLLDARTSLGPEEIRQIQLLFGKESVVRRLLGRDLVDLRVPSDDSKRWEERKIGSGNVLGGLRQAVEFVARRLALDGASMDGLSSTTGSPDYLAMREALVNLYIHQDYAAAGAAAQVELRPQKATFFNPGHSLVDPARLAEGGKSHSRNPLIARALRLIGFAELAGSGLTTVQRAWRQAHRRPPRVETSRESNSFTFTLDWREVVDVYDAHWKTRIGARVTPEQAIILNLAADPAGVGLGEIVAGTGLTVEDATGGVQHLIRQVLLCERDGRYFIADHLREVIP